VQLSGAVVRVRIDILHLEFERRARIRNLFVSYSETLLAQIQQTVACNDLHSRTFVLSSSAIPRSQTVACNALHSTRQKMCRWLLMMHDRADGELLTYTHEFLAQVLGVNRKSVTLGAQALQREGLIDYHRGLMQILDRPGLEKASCERYAIVKKRFDDFLSPPPHAFKRFGMGGNSTGHGTFSLRLNG
jgi:Crp-like helix-turn-helix domain